MSVTGRSSSITNAFVNAIVPVIEPTLEDELEALRILAMSPEDIRCAYCGDRATEWDHFRAIIKAKAPTGYITEIANLVPACGKCNQSKGATAWKTWMLGPAKLSPTTRGIADIQQRIARLEAYEAWRQPTLLNFEDIVGVEMWQRHRKNWQQVLALLQESQVLAAEIRKLVVERANKSFEPTRMDKVENAKGVRDDRR